MPRRASVPAALAAVLIAVMPALAGDPPSSATSPAPQSPTAADDLFQMIPAVGRQLKIDRRTGRVSICEEKGGDWACRLVADDRLAYEDEIARLEADNAKLAARVAELEEAGSGRGVGGPWITPDDEKKLDEFMTFSDKAIRRFFGMVEGLKRDFDQPDRL